MSKQNLIVVSNRLPVTVSKLKGKLVFNSSPGGLATAMSAVNKDESMLWVGWPGIESDGLTSAEKREITTELKKSNCVPVFLNSAQIENFYEGYSNETLWPLFHYFQSLAQFNESHWNAYKEVNLLFAQAVSKHADHKSTIWVHDYHLTLVPNELRKVIPGASIGFFLHIPFPSFEIFRLLPHRKEILEGILGSDLVGFHIYDYVRHFTSSVMRTLGYESKGDSIIYKGRIIRADAFPIGIDYRKFEEAPNTEVVKREVKLLSEFYKGKKILLSVDRLDYSKGIAKRLEAFERFLSEKPKHHKKITMIMVAVPSRTEVEAYKDLRDTVEQTVSRINGKYATVDWVPVSYQYQNLPFDKLSALYSKADIALVTPIRDGMNLVAKEYVASRQKKPGVLILSELAGAVDEMPEALVVNPNDIMGMVSAIDTAINMPVKQQKKRITAMQRRISNYDVYKWANDFLEQMDQSNFLLQSKGIKLLSKEKSDQIAASFKKAKNRLIILDYDGTLTPFVSSSKASASKPTAQLLEVLEALTRIKGTQVQIISGRPHEALDEWFGKLDINLVAEHGFWIKQGKNWKSSNFDTEIYKQLALPLLIKYTERTPGAVIEDKSSSLVWHYRNVNPELAFVRMRGLKHDLNELLHGSEAGVYDGHKIIEIKPTSIGKGVIVRNLLKEKKHDFILCAGDDYTDEDMFQSLKSHEAFTIKVGLGDSKADYHVLDTKSMINLLAKLTTG